MTGGKLASWARALAHVRVAQPCFTPRVDPAGLHWTIDRPEPTLPKPNYSFEKRQREIAKKKKQDEKNAKKQAAKDQATRDAERAAGTGSDTAG